MLFSAAKSNQIPVSLPSQSTLDDVETRRILDQARYRILHATDNPRIERIARAAALALKVPYVSISLFLEGTIYRVAAIGLPAHFRSHGRTLTERAHRVGGPCRISDMLDDPYFADHPLTMPPIGARAAAMVPFRSSDSGWGGSIAILSPDVRNFDDEEMEILGEFAEIARAELDGYRALCEKAVREEFFKCVFEGVHCGISLNRANGTRVAVNSRLASMLGYSTSEMMDKHFLQVTDPDDVDGGRILHAMWSRGEIDHYERQARLVRKDGSVLWAQIKASTMVVPGSSELFCIVMVEDIDHARKTEAARDLLISEINHRVKNTLAITQGLSKQILRLTRSPQEFIEAFEDRIAALAKSHDLLMEHFWEPIPLESVFSELKVIWEPYRRQIEVELPPIELNSQTIVMLWLILNELMSNAVKHGALRNSSGQVKLVAAVFEQDDTRWLSLDWDEQAEHAIQPSTRRGLGSYLIERASRLGLGGEGQIAFHPTGIHCGLKFPVYDSHYILRQPVGHA